MVCVCVCDSKDLSKKVKQRELSVALSQTGDFPSGPHETQATSFSPDMKVGREGTDAFVALCPSDAARGLTRIRWDWLIPLKKLTQ